MDQNQSYETKTNAEKELLEIYNKEDIMNMLNCESAKALKLLRVMHQMHIAFKIGREYYVYKKDFVKFLNDFKGRTVLI